MSRIDWYFDFISPFSYFQLLELGRARGALELAAQPVLFAGLLNHWGSKGPAEIPAKRRFTYRFVQWYAERRGIAFRMPAAHPFNPLPALRLATALEGDPGAIEQIFRFIWAEGRLLDDERDRAALAERLGIAELDALLAEPRVKQALRDNTDRAIARGVFGVPTAMVGETLFWGVDSTEMLLAYLDDPQGFESAEMHRVSELPVGVTRKTGA